MNTLSSWKKLIHRLHPEGIPWPASILYNAASKSNLFLRQYEAVAKDVTQYCHSGRILDIGTGPARLLLELHKLIPTAELIGVDISAAMIEKAKINIAQAGCADKAEAKVADAGNLPFADEYFDCVISTGSLHHWKHREAGLNEVHRVLKPGSYALIYDLVRKMPEENVEHIKKQIGSLRLALLWLHSFEEPFLCPDDMKKLAENTLFGHGDIRFVGALCCLVLKKGQV